LLAIGAAGYLRKDVDRDLLDRLRGDCRSREHPR
jgi:hypothetical protein